MPLGAGGVVPLRRGSRRRSPGSTSREGRVRYEATGRFARMLQHEYDHLNGFLYVDRLTGKWSRKARKVVKGHGWGVPGLTWLPGSTATPSATTTTRPRRSVPTDDRPRVVAVVGPTATGKSDLGLRLAEVLEGRSSGPMPAALPRDGHRHGDALARGAPRCAAPPGRRPRRDGGGERRRVPATRAGRPRGGAPTAADPGRRGGPASTFARCSTGSTFPPTDAEVRRRLEDRAAEEGTPAVHAALAAVDPEAAAAVEPNNRRRIVRALEVVELTGRPLLGLHAQAGLRPPAVVLGLCRPARCSTARIAERSAGCGPRACSRRSAA